MDFPILLLGGRGVYSDVALESRVLKTGNLRMSKSKRRAERREKRQKIAEERLLELQSFAQPMHVEVCILNRFPMHIRLHGKRTVDYWPATSRAWVYGTNERARVMLPEQVARLARIGNDLDEEFKRMFA